MSCDGVESLGQWVKDAVSLCGSADEDSGFTMISETWSVRLRVEWMKRRAEDRNLNIAATLGASAATNTPEIQGMIRYDIIIYYMLYANYHQLSISTARRESDAVAKDLEWIKTSRTFWNGLLDMNFSYQAHPSTVWTCHVWTVSSILKTQYFSRNFFGYSTFPGLLPSDTAGQDTCPARGLFVIGKDKTLRLSHLPSLACAFSDFVEYVPHLTP